VLAFFSFGGDPRIAGWLIASFGLGALVGNVLAYRAVSRTDGLLLVAAGIGFQALPLWLLVLPVPAVAVGAALAASGLANGVVNPSLHSILTLRAPPPLRPQVMTAMITAAMLVAPVALSVTGPALDAFGMRPVFAAAVALQSAATVLIAAAAVRARRASAAAPAVAHA